MNIIDTYNYELDNYLNDKLGDIEGTEESEIQDTSGLKYLFDPRQIKITVETTTIYNLVQRLKSRSIDLYPDFQRKDNLWKVDRQSLLIESVLLRFPLPAFYFDIELDGNDEENWLVVDGVQRLSTFKNFIIDNSFKLGRLEILKDYEGYFYKELDGMQRRRILETQVTTFKIQPGTPKDVKYHIFKRINTGGLGLTPMEIRYALNQKGIAGRFLRDLTEDNDSFFKKFLEENKIRAYRMEDRELLLRYVAFMLTSYQNYEPNLSDFLNVSIERLDNLSLTECKCLENSLQNAIDTYYTLFDNKRFGKNLTNYCRLNSPLFEVWASELGKLNSNERHRLILRKEDIKTEYEKLLDYEVFQSSFTKSTSNKIAVRTRFTFINNLIQSFLND